MSLLVRFLFHSWFHIERHTVRNVNVNRLCVCVIPSSSSYAMICRNLWREKIETICIVFLVVQRIFCTSVYIHVCDSWHVRHMVRFKRRFFKKQNKCIDDAMIYFAFSIDFFCRWNRFENVFFRCQARLRSKSWIVASWWHVGLLFWWQQRRRFQDADQKKNKSINRIFLILSFVMFNISFDWCTDF